jgi:hypothetical protein
MAEVTRRQADLDLLESKMKIRRASIETAGREALEQTAKELDEVLRIGLGEIETELEGRHARLESRANELLADLRTDGSTTSTGPEGNGTGETGEKPDPEKTRVTGRRFQTLVGEIESLQDSLAAMRCSGLEQPPSEAQAVENTAGIAAAKAMGVGLRAADPVGSNCEQTGTVCVDRPSPMVGGEDLYDLKPIKSQAGRQRPPPEAE